MHAALALLVHAATAAPHSGEVAFVASSSTPLRQGANADAPRLKDLAIWTPVKVDRVDGAFVHVVVGPRALRYDSLGGEARPVAPLAFPPSSDSGWVAAADVDTAPPSRAALLEQAKAAAEKDRQVLLLRAWALDPFDVDTSRLVGPAAARTPVSRRLRSPFLRAELVFGCRGDLSRAVVVGGSLAGLGGARPPDVAGDVCVGHIDVRPPCGPADDDDDKDPQSPERARLGVEAQAAYKAALSRLVPRFGNDGPALRLQLAARGSDRPVFVATRLLVADGCAGCAATASTVDVKVTRLRVPVGGDDPTLLHVVVPRYAGVVYDVVTAERAADVDVEAESFELGDAFDADPRDEPGPGDHLFMAPESCGCPCDD